MINSTTTTSNRLNNNRQRSATTRTSPTTSFNVESTMTLDETTVAPSTSSGASSISSSATMATTSRPMTRSFTKQQQQQQQQSSNLTSHHQQQQVRNSTNKTTSSRSSSSSSSQSNSSFGSPMDISTSHHHQHQHHQHNIQPPTLAFLNSAESIIDDQFSSAFRDNNTNLTLAFGSSTSSTNTISHTPFSVGLPATTTSAINTFTNFSQPTSTAKSAAPLTHVAYQKIITDERPVNLISLIEGSKTSGRSIRNLSSVDKKYLFLDLKCIFNY